MTDLITIDEYKDLSGIVSGKEDTKLDIIIPSVSQLVKTYCANSIVDYYAVDKVETFTLENPYTSLQLTESPVNSVSLVEEKSGGEYVTLAATDYFIDSKTDSLFRVQAASFISWATGPGAVRVTYRAGYSDTPADLKLAVADLITYYLRGEYKIRQTLSGASQENPGSYMDVNWPAHIKRVLDMYRLIL